MPSKYQNEVIKLEESRDNLISGEIELIYDDIRSTSKRIATGVKEAAGNSKTWINQYNRRKRLEDKVKEELKPLYVKRDGVVNLVYVAEYPTAYTQAAYEIVNKGIATGHKVKMRKYTQKQFTDALEYPLSKLIDKTQMSLDRSKDIKVINDVIRNGLIRGDSLDTITKEIDFKLGYRDKAGKYIGDAAKRKGQQYQTRRILRTEVGRMRSTAASDEWLQQQSIVPSELVWLATLDKVTRAQSAQMDGQVAIKLKSMDGQISNNAGEFVFPNGVIAKQSQSGVAAYDINDRCSVYNRDADYSGTDRIAKDKDGNYTIQPYDSYSDYADDLELVKNDFGQVLFPEKK